MFGSPMLVPDLAPLTERWPGFAPAAVDAGARALFAFPLQAGAIRAGMLLLYRAQPGPLTPQQLADALVFADIALQLLLDSSCGHQRVWPATSRLTACQTAGPRCTRRPG